jgi:hypothetical protein
LRRLQELRQRGRGLPEGRHGRLTLESGGGRCAKGRRDGLLLCAGRVVSSRRGVQGACGRLPLLEGGEALVRRGQPRAEARDVVAEGVERVVSEICWGTFSLCIVP